MVHPMPHARIIVDEVGVATARLGCFLLKTRFDPIFARDGGSFHPVAAEAATAVFVDGVALPRTQMPVHRGDALDTEIAMHLRNRWNIGTAEIDRVVLFAAPRTLVQGHATRAAGQDAWRGAIAGHGVPFRWSPLVGTPPESPGGGLGLRCGIDLDHLRLDASGRPVRVERPMMIAVDMSVLHDAAVFDRLSPILSEAAKAGIHALATGIETMEALDEALSAGFSHFQGAVFGVDAACAGALMALHPMRLGVLPGNSGLVRQHRPH